MASLSTCHLGIWLGWQILLNLVKSSSKKKPKIRKYLALAEILIKDAATTSATCTKQNIAFMKVGWFAYQRSRTYTGKYAKAKAVNTLRKRKAWSRVQYVKYLFTRSDNATCLLGKKDYAKVGKEKKQVYILKEYLHNLYQKYC